MLKFILKFFFSLWKAVTSIFSYFFYVIIYILFGLADRELFEWEESFFYRRPVPDDFSSTAESQGWNIENEYAALDFVVDEEAEDEFSDYGLGRFFYSYFNPFSFYIYKRLNNEFIYSFLEFFFITMLRVLFLFLFFFFFFFYVVYFCYVYVVNFFIIYFFFSCLFFLFLKFWVLFIYFLNFFFIENVFMFFDFNFLTVL